eukprot:673688-Rhodomonas_salina.1
MPHLGFICLFSQSILHLTLACLRRFRGRRVRRTLQARRDSHSHARLGSWARNLGHDVPGLVKPEAGLNVKDGLARHAQ